MKTLKKQAIILLIVILAVNCSAQISFEKGYYINNSGERVNCLIKNNDWKNNPLQFKYKLSEEGEIQIAHLKSVAEFGIDGSSKYIRETVKIDKSSDNIQHLSHNMNPEFNEEELFLKVLIEGKANLYMYEKGILQRFFYQLDAGKIEQLVFKTYRTSSNQLKKNRYFQQQIWNNLKCPAISKKRLEQLEYKKRSLLKLFAEYNSCHLSDYVNFEAKTQRDFFSLNIRPRFVFSSLSIQNSLSGNRDTDFGAKANVSLGVEAEFVLPFHKNKWSLLIEPTYQRLNSEQTMERDNVSGGILVSQVDYTSLEFPIGIRHYFFFREQSKIFVNASLIFDFTTHSSIHFKRADDSPLNSLDMLSRNNFAAGIGYTFKNRYSLEARYQSGRDVLSNYTFWDSSYRSFSLILGYSLF